MLLLAAQVGKVLGVGSIVGKMLGTVVAGMTMAEDDRIDQDGMVVAENVLAGTQEGMKAANFQ